MPVLPLVFAMSLMFVTGCSSNPKTRTAGQANNTLYDKYKNNRSQIENDADDMEELLSASDMRAVESNRMDVLRYGDMWQRIRAGFNMNLSVNNSRIESQKSWFISRQPYIDRLSARASRYLYYTVAEAERRGIPTELALLPVIESSYDPTATSNAAAAGMWQFIPSTGRIYGLRQTETYDGRRDVIESTRAAYDFLTSLYNKFGSWELALAAYNCGPGCVNRAIKKNARSGRRTDYWSLRLPKETMNYVPRFLAVAKIVNDPISHGVRLPSIANRPHFRSVPIQSGVALGKVSRLTGLSLDILYDLNPALIQGHTDIDGPNRLLVPTSMPYRFDQRISKLSGYGFSSTSGYTANSTRLPVKTLDSAEAATLMSSGSMPRYGGSAAPVSLNTSVGDSASAFYQAERKKLPKSARGLADFAASARVPNQTINYIQPKVTPVSPQVADTQPATVASKPVVKTNQQRLQTQVLADINALPTSAAEVTKNETVVQFPALSQSEREQIAAEIKQADPTVKDVIDPLDGEIKLEAIQTQQSVLAAQGIERKLTFETPVKKPKKAKKTVKKPTGKRTVYRVKSGDSLKKIGERHGLYWRDIAKWNQIDPTASLYVGTPLYLYDAKLPKRVEKPKEKPTQYRVQAGDTMIGVANKFGMSASQLAKRNGMKALDDLIIGKTLTLVDSGKGNPQNKDSKASAKPAKASKTVAKKPTTYQVQAGDGLIQLAKRFGVSTKALADANGLSPTKDLYVGQSLKVPVAGTTASKSARQTEKTQSKKKPTSYVVESGDTMIYVARKFGLSTNKLATLNGMKPMDDLIIGKRLTLVDDGKTTVSTRKSKSNKVSAQKKTDKKPPKKQPTSYVVESGDTMIYVARKFKLSTNKLANMNGMKPFDALRIGQRLTLVDTGKVSKSRKNSAKTTRKSAKKDTKKSKNVKRGMSRYKVKAGDGLIALARKYGMSTAELAKLNKMKPTDALKLGQTIKVPRK